MKRLLLLGPLLLAGCAVGPNYRQPKSPAPTGWETGAHVAPAVVEWWRTFHDPLLNSLVERAMQTNHNVRIAEARLREARALRTSTAWDLGPTITGAAGYTESLRAENAQAFTVPNQKLATDLYDAHFDARWEIDIFGGKRRALEAAAAAFAGVEEDVRAVFVSVLAEVARNYGEVRGAQQRRAIARKNIAAQTESLEIARARFQAGLTGELDVKQAEALLATTQSRLPALETMEKAGIHRLSVLVGQLPEALLQELTPVAEIPVTPPTVPVGLPSDLLRRRPDVRRAEHELNIATANIGVETAELFPKFSLIGTAGFQSLSATDWFVPNSRYWSAGPTVTWRLLEFGKIRARVKAANARQEQALAGYERTVLLAFEDVENALVAYANEQLTQRSLMDAVAANRRAVEMVKELYATGLVGFLKVLDAERALYQVEDQLVDSQRALTADVVALYKALGGGWEKKYDERSEAK